MNCWKILGIEKTDDKRAIKKAYAMKARELHPEEHPEEFRELHEAYEYALRYANNAPKSRIEAPAEKPKEETDIFDSLDEYEPEAPVEIHEEVSESDLFDSITEAAAAAPAEETEQRQEELKIDFDEILEQDAISYFEKVVALTQKSLDELEKLYKKKKRKFKAWNEVCKSDYFCEAGLHPYFIDNITKFVKERTDLPKNCYAALYDVYKFGELKTRADKGYLTELYEIFEQRNMLKAKKSSAMPAVWGGIATAILATARIASLDDEGAGLLTVIVAVLILALSSLTVYFIIKKRREEAKKSPEIKALEKKRREEYRKAINPTWNPVLHVKRNQYYAKEVLLAWNVLMLLSIFWISNYEDDTSIIIGMLAMILSASVMVSVFFANLIIFLNSRMNNADTVSLSTKKGFRVALCANIWMFLLNVFCVFAEESTSDVFDILACLLFVVPIGWLLIKGIAIDIKKWKEKKQKKRKE